MLPLYCLLLVLSQIFNSQADLSLRQLNFKKNGPILLFKILFRHSEIILLKKLFQPFEVLILCLRKAMVSALPDEICFLTSS